jgi:hypothetical protein
MHKVVPHAPRERRGASWTRVPGGRGLARGGSPRAACHVVDARAAGLRGLTWGGSPRASWSVVDVRAAGARRAWARRAGSGGKGWRGVFSAGSVSRRGSSRRVGAASGEWGQGLAWGGSPRASWSVVERRAAWELTPRGCGERGVGAGVGVGWFSASVVERRGRSCCRGAASGERGRLRCCAGWFSAGVESRRGRSCRGGAGERLRVIVLARP